MDSEAELELEGADSVDSDYEKSEKSDDESCREGGFIVSDLSDSDMVFSDCSDTDDQR